MSNKKAWFRSRQVNVFLAKSVRQRPHVTLIDNKQKIIVLMATPVDVMNPGVVFGGRKKNVYDGRQPLHWPEKDFREVWEARVVGGVDRVLWDDGVLVETLGLGDQGRPGQVHRVSKWVEETVPGLSNTFVSHLFRYHQACWGGATTRIIWKVISFIELKYWFFIIDYSLWPPECLAKKKWLCRLTNFLGEC